jgi:CRISPR-associated protein Csb2
MLRALRWLERQGAPDIFTPPIERDRDGQPAPGGHRTFVPDNIGDLVAGSWSAGREASLGDYRTEKDIRSIRMVPESNQRSESYPAIHYVYRSIDTDAGKHLDVLGRAARSLTHLGWGIDQVVGDLTTSQPVGARGELWAPTDTPEVNLRTPVDGSFDDLERRYDEFLGRLDGELLRPVWPLRAFGVVGYQREGLQPPPPFAAFRLVRPQTRQLLAFDAASRTRDVAAWVRHATSVAAEGWPFADSRVLIHGHTPDKNVRAAPGERLSFLPLPTLSWRDGRSSRREDTMHVGDVSRVVVAAPEGFRQELRWLETRLGEADLEWDGQIVASLEPLPSQDAVLRRYLGRHAYRQWATVTPIVLPGHDDGSERKAERLIRKTFAQAGWAPELIARVAQVELGRAGFCPGVAHAKRYLAPDKVVGPQYHVRLTFTEPVRGPLSLGAGRYRGVGLLAGLR